MFTITGLYTYPVKSLGGTSLPEAIITTTGFKYDRRWMLIDENNKFISQREFPVMAQLTAAVLNDELNIHHEKQAGNSINIPLETQNSEFKKVTVWDDTCEAQLVSTIADEWFADILHAHCRLVFMPEDSKRPVDVRYAKNNESITFSDGYQFLMIGEESLADLNSRMTEALPMNRFRPNIVFSGGEPYCEDYFEHFTIGTVAFIGVKQCGRCMITTINQQTTEKGKEPLKTLSGYRAQDNKIYFGQYLLHNGEGTLKTGATITVNKMKPRSADVF